MRKSSTRAVLLVALTAMLAAVPASAMAADLTSPETLFLDSFRAPKATITNAVTTVGTLAAGVSYTAVVSGTWSAYLPKYMKDTPPSGWQLCGTPESAPTTPSAGQPDSRVGQDAETIFARPWQSPCPTPPHQVPFNNPAFLIDLGSGLTHITPVGGPYNAPRADHTYTYQLVGQGAPVSFAMLDSNTADNDGVLTIVVSPTVPSPPSPPLGGTTTATSTGSSSSGNSISTPTSKTCLSRRHFKIHIVSHRADPVITASVRVRNKTQRLRLHKSRGSRLIANVDLRGLKKGTNIVTIVARTKSGRVLVSHRTYHTCVEKRLLRVSVVPKHDRTAPFTYRVSGSLKRSPNVPASACKGGAVIVNVAFGRKSLITKRTRLNGSCRFSMEVRPKVPSKAMGRTLTVRARFLGTKRVKRSQSWPVSIKAG